MFEKESVKLRAGKFRIPVVLIYEDGYIYFQFRYNKSLIAEIKAMEGARWLGFDDPPRKIWRVADSPHNHFQISYLKGENPYSLYDTEIIKHEYDRPLYEHQKQATDFILARRKVLLAGEMGCVDGQAIVHIKRGVKPNNECITLEELFNIFHFRRRGIRTYIKTIIDYDFRYVEILNVIRKGAHSVLRIETENGQSIIVTPDHEVGYDYDTFTSAVVLRVGDILRTCTSLHNVTYSSIVRIDAVPDCEVYDVVCVDPHHHFLANNIHVHNCGKTLSAIEVMERSGVKDWWYVAPRSAIKAVDRELSIWDSKINPEMMTYEGLTKRMKIWGGQKAPGGVVFDESSRVKNSTAQRSQAALALANGVRQDHGEDGYVLLMSGAPAPKSPVDWFHQAKIACPGYLKEGTQAKFKNRLAIIEQKEGPYGQAYPSIVSWLDDEKKCKICGQYQIEHSGEDHEFEPSTNEVAKLYRRMSGLVLVQFKKDCLDLPDKIYRHIELKPSQKILNVAESIVAGASTVIGGLTLLRELSDGFQYFNEATGYEQCSVCNGSGQITNPMLDSDLPDSSLPENPDLENQFVHCDGCGGKGKRKTYTRVTKQVETPKEEALRDLLDEYIDVGRVVVYGGFTGSIDRIIEIVTKNGWDYIRVDGRGWHSNLEGDHLENFQEKLVKYPRIAFVGQPGAAGMGLTLTASPVIVYWSNDFNADSRIQSEDRIHRIGMDNNRGATIIDLLHLGTDYLVLENLQKKRKLQAMSMGEITKALKSGVKDEKL